MLYTYFKNSTHTIYWTTKWLKKHLRQFTDQMKKAKKVLESCKWTFHKGQYLIPLNINLASVSEHVRKKLWNLLSHLIPFTDLTNTATKQQTVESILSICHSLILSNISKVYVSWHFQNAMIIYRSDLHNLQTRRKKLKE